MRAGSLRRAVVLEVRVQDPDGSTGITETYETVTEAWADIQATRGSVYIGAMQVGGRLTHRILLRWVDPTTFTHISDGAQRFKVREARDPDGRRRWLEVMAEEMTAESA